MALLPCALSAQDRFVPTVENESRSSALPFGGNQPAVGDDQVVLVDPVMSLSVTTAESVTLTQEGVIFSGLTVARQEELRMRLQFFLNRPLTEQALLTLTELVVSHYEENDRPVVEVWVPPQDENDQQTLTVRVIEGKVGQVQLREPRYFDSGRLAPALWAKNGRLLRSSDLTATTSWLSRNPFRKAELFVAAGSGEGEADLVFALDEKRPWRGYVGYENTGTEVTGESRFLLGGIWGNAFGFDHIVAYQATLGSDLDQFQAHGLSWEAPIHHRHEFLRLTSSWAEVSSEAMTNLGSADIEGSSFQVALSYGRQVIRGDWQGEFSGGLEFKRSDTFLTFSDQVDLSSDSPVEVVQFRLNAQLQKAAKTESGWNTDLRVSLVASPGGFSGRNTDGEFASYRAGADASYLYLRGNGQWSRGWKDWTLLVRAEAQVASGALLPSEQLGMGGMRTVRGYREREFLADSGWWGSVEARSPAWRSQFWEKEFSVQGLFFVDHGFTWREGEDAEQLFSLGLGARAQWGGATLRADLGVPLTEGEQDSDPRAHVGLTYRW
ncbi:MAG: ShlB/FhaC/HecB family hemolysin secretion/activation protein [Roseibacillus sp.]